jgi:hypothetical protein
MEGLMLCMLMINYDPSIPFEGPLLQPEHAKLEQNCASADCSFLEQV